MVILLLEQVPSQGVQFSEDISGGSSISPALISGPKLPYRLKEVEIVGTYEVLSHGDDCATERHLSVMVS